MIVMDCLSAEAHCLTRKLCFLRRITDSSSDTLSSQTLFALSDDIESVCLIRECLELEEHFNTNFTHLLLLSSSDSESDEESRPSPRQIKDQIVRTDKSLLLEKCRKNEDTRLIGDITRMVSWSKLWDLALNDGPKCVNALRAFVRIISYPSHSNRACPLCDVNSLDSSLLAHILSSHADSSNDASDILDSLWSSVSITASNSNVQDSGHDTSYTSSMNAVNISSTSHPDLSSLPNSDSDTGFSQFFNMIYPLHMLFSYWSYSCLLSQYHVITLISLHFSFLMMYPTCMCYVQSNKLYLFIYLFVAGIILF